ncbi:centromere protein R [Centroberyx gerrardi]|uniref:centromere protein R n=1 Tax=Centroberyx gerrardi TaxID=166262 RepID=UPI003AACF7F8
MDNTQSHTPSKIPAPDRNYSPLTGTASLPPGHAIATTHKQKVPQTDREKLDSLRSKLEGSEDAFIKARKELEEIVSAEGSSKLRSFFTRGSADLKTELKRHRELTSRVESSLEGNDARQNPFQGGTRTGSSYEFLKSIMG